MGDSTDNAKFDEAGFDRARRAIETANRIALLCHVSPDGDALGSMLAMALFLERIGKAWAASFPEPFTIPPTYSFLPGIDRLSPPQELLNEPFDLVMTFDCASADRTAELSTLVEKASCVVVIDHHYSNPRYGDINLVFPDASSSSEIVFEFMRFSGIELDKDIATCLYVGVATDTGRFQYSNTTARVFEIAADLVSTGVSVDQVSRKVFEEARLASLRLLGEILCRAEFHERSKAVTSWFGYKDLERYGVDLAETDEYIDVLRKAKEAEVVILAKELEPGVFKLSLRSLGAVDVAEIAGRFGGGGHRMAAGCTIEGSLEHVLNSLMSQLPSEFSKDLPAL